MEAARELGISQQLLYDFRDLGGAPIRGARLRTSVVRGRRGPGVGEGLFVPLSGLGLRIEQPSHRLTMTFRRKAIPRLPLQNESSGHPEQLGQLQWVEAESLS